MSKHESVSGQLRSCQHCQFYTPQGRRGGYCQQLEVAVKSRWQACALAAAPFNSAAKSAMAPTLSPSRWDTHPADFWGHPQFAEPIPMAEAIPMVEAMFHAEGFHAEGFHPDSFHPDGVHADGIGSH
jgi:hypothetical protein